MIGSSCKLVYIFLHSHEKNSDYTLDEWYDKTLMADWGWSNETTYLISIVCMGSLCGAGEHYSLTICNYGQGWMWERWWISIRNLIEFIFFYNVLLDVICLPCELGRMDEDNCEFIYIKRKWTSNVLCRDKCGAIVGTERLHFYVFN